MRTYLNVSVYIVFLLNLISYRANVGGKSTKPKLISPFNFVRTLVKINNQDFMMMTHHPHNDVVSSLIHKNLRVFCDDRVLFAITRCIKTHKDKCTFLDVGSNIGSCSLFAAVQGARVIAVEAVYENAFLTYLNGALNNVSISVYPYGASNITSIEPMVRGRNNKGHNVIGDIIHKMGADYYQKEVTNISLFLLDDFISERIHVMKIDVEGHEYRVIQGATNLIKTYGVDEIIFEMCPILLSSNYRAPYEITRYLQHLTESLNYTIYKEYNVTSGPYIPLSTGKVLSADLEGMASNRGSHIEYKKRVNCYDLVASKSV